ncbi:hypothetical protein M422DRAFT_264351 [Sphaerobolus stellatus SS14]|uniref:Uncharacterized protein n=1 Tax=Sphaerobolus stellatus (strain SS14) TaxID=990650 RepID=A0A0C9V8E9_SPHS4|nr:hypothetical protein M422DRAFT_264351 [Sphaerobolus stellatus SS14]
MSHNRGPRRTRAEELSTADIEDSEPTTGDLMNSPSPSVDPQQSPRMLHTEHPEDPHATAHGSQTAPSREQSPSRVGMRPHTATQGLSPSRLAGGSGPAHQGSPSPPRVASITATQGRYSPRGITHRSESQTSEVGILRQEYSEFITLKDNAEIVLAEAMEAMERLNTELFSVPSNQASGKTLEPGNNRAHDKAAAQAATQCIIDQTSMADPAPGSGAEERARTTRSRVPGDRYSRAPLPRNIPEDIPHQVRDEQGEDSQPRRGSEAHTVYARDTPEARALDSNAQYWSDLSNKAARRSCRALELQFKLAEEKVNNLLHEEAPEEALLEAAQEARTIHFQLDQNSRLREAGLMPEQQVRFSVDTGRNVPSPSRNYGVNPIREEHTPRPKDNDGAVVNMTSEYSSIQQMVRQALQNASLEDEPEKSFLAKAGVKMGNPPTYGGERNLEKFENWVASILQFMSMYNLLGPRASKIQLQLLGQCLTDEAQEWFYRQVERFD